MCFDSWPVGRPHLEAQVPKPGIASIPTEGVQMDSRLQIREAPSERREPGALIPPAM